MDSDVMQNHVRGVDSIVRVSNLKLFSLPFHLYEWSLTPVTLKLVSIDRRLINNSTEARKVK